MLSILACNLGAPLVVSASILAISFLVDMATNASARQLMSRQAAAARRGTHLGKDTDGKYGRGAESPRGRNPMQTREPELTFLRFANRFLQVPANIVKKAGKADAPPVDRRPLAACTAVNDAGVGQKRSGGAGNERGMGDGELYFFLFFPKYKYVTSTFSFFCRATLDGR